MRIKSLLSAQFLLALLYLFCSSVVPVFASITYSYDANGNLTSDGTNCYTYNDANQLSKVTSCGTGQTIAQYLYDYQGNRIEKKVYTGGTLQNTTYTPTKNYQTVKPASGLTSNTSYYYVNDQLVAQKNPDGSKYYVLSDNLGSTTVLTNQSGGVVENTAYYPFGQIRSGGTQSKYLYTGQQNDQETALDYYNARYYNPSIMHFTQPDSVVGNMYDPQQLNRYAYVRNNPMTNNDPSGHCGIFCFVSGGLATAALEVGGAVYGALTSNNTSFAGRVQGAIVGAQKAVESPVGQIALGVATFGVGTVAEAGLQNSSSDEVTSLRGTQNPIISAKAAYGRFSHTIEQYDQGFIKEYTGFPGIRLDAANPQTQQFVELKPNTPTGISKGIQQIQGYQDSIFNQTGQVWTGSLKTYEPPTIDQLEKYLK